jgi:hypothetical protein
MALVHIADGEPIRTSVSSLTGSLKGLAEKKRRPQKIVLTGYLRVKTPGFYQLSARSNGRLKISLHQKVRLDEVLSKNDAEAFLPIGLEAGWHPLEIELEPGSRRPFLRLVLAGADEPTSLVKTNLGHGAVEAGNGS